MTKDKNYQKAIKLIAKYKTEDAQIRNCKGDAELQQIVRKINARATQKAENVTVKQFCDNLIINRLNEIANALPDEGYSMGSYVIVYFNALKGIHDRTSSYARSCKYRPTYGCVDLYLSLDEMIKTKVIANLVTYIYPNQSKKKVKKCYWYEGKGAKQHFRLIKVDGYICDDYHTDTKEKALNYFSVNERNRKLQVRQEALYNKALRKQYTYQDSLDAGNCEAGTKAFIIRCGLDITKKYRGSYLINIATQKSNNSISYVKRMIEYKATLNLKK